MPAHQVPAVTVDGRRIATRPAAVLRHDRTFVPLRGVFRHLGATVIYAHPASVVVVKGGTRILHLRIGSTVAYVDGHRRHIGGAPFRMHQHVYVPLRLVAEAAGATVTYRADPPRVAIWPPRPRRGPAALAPRAAYVNPVPEPSPPTLPAARPAWLIGLISMLVLALALVGSYVFWRLREDDEPIIVTRSFR